MPSASRTASSSELVSLGRPAPCGESFASTGTRTSWTLCRRSRRAPGTRPPSARPRRDAPACRATSASLAGSTARRFRCRCARKTRTARGASPPLPRDHPPGAPRLRARLHRTRRRQRTARAPSSVSLRLVDELASRMKSPELGMKASEKRQDRCSPEHADRRVDAQLRTPRDPVVYRRRTPVDAPRQSAVGTSRSGTQSAGSSRAHVSSASSQAAWFPWIPPCTYPTAAMSAPATSGHRAPQTPGPPLGNREQFSLPRPPARRGDVRRPTRALHEARRGADLPRLRSPLASVESALAISTSPRCVLRDPELAHELVTRLVARGSNETARPRRLSGRRHVAALERTDTRRAQATPGILAELLDVRRSVSPSSVRSRYACSRW